MTDKYSELDAALGQAKPYDAHNSAKQGEPTFTLQAGDPYAADLTSLWAALMGGQVPLVEEAISATKQTLNHEISLDNSFGEAQMEKGKVAKAYSFALQLRDYPAGQNTSDLDYDAHVTAKADELTFTLQGEDPYCADMVELWAALMSGNINEADMRFGQIRETLLAQLGSGNTFGKTQLGKGKITKAYSLAEALKKTRHNVDQA